MQPPKTLRSDALQAIESCAGWNSRLASRRITQFLEKRMTGSGLTIAQFGLMAQIAAASDDTLGSLAERLSFDQSSLSRNLHALEREGLVEIAVVEHDLRRRAVWLTENGAQRLEAALPVWQSAHAALTQIIKPGLAQRLANASQALMGA
jgi:DNA-binding MarR family transcriptional regulator